MSDEPKPEGEVQELEAEAKPGKKAKAAKKKGAEPQTEEAPAEATTAEAATANAATAEAPPAAPAAAAGDDIFAKGVQALLHADYTAADNFFGQALTNSRKNGDQAGQVAALEQLGHLCFLRGAEAQAQDYYRQAGQLRAA
jgi:hypothetical protein